MIFKNPVDWFMHPQSVRHDFYITGVIEEAEDYHTLLQCLATATERDLVYLHINTPGGNFATACQICDAILQSKAGAVVGCAEGEVLSAGTMIFLACNAWHVSDFSTFMFHTSSGGQLGKMPDTLKQAESHKEHLNRVASILYSPFFDEVELNEIINLNQDAWLTPEEVTERLQYVAEFMEAEAADAEEAEKRKKIEEFEKAVEKRVEERMAEELANATELIKTPSALDPTIVTMTNDEVRAQDEAPSIEEDNVQTDVELLLEQEFKEVE
ncbi:ATP-dependent protease [Vibrio phage D479]